MATWLVFGRTEFAAPLSHRGEVEAGSPDDARAAALDAHGDGWVELVVVRADEVRWALGPERPGRVA